MHRALAGIVIEGGVGQGSEQGHNGKGRAAPLCRVSLGQIWECKAGIITRGPEAQNLDLVIRAFHSVYPNNSPIQASKEKTLWKG